MMTSTWKAGSLLALAAIAGGAVGSLITTRAMHRDDPGPHGISWFIGLIDQEVSLTAAEKDSVRAVLMRRDGDMDSIWAEMRPRIDSTRNSIRDEIAGQLTLEQQQKFRALTARLDAERMERIRKERAARESNK